MVHNLSCLKRGSGCCAIDDLLHSSPNLVFRQHKLHNIISFGMAYWLQNRIMRTDLKETSKLPKQKLIFKELENGLFSKESNGIQILINDLCWFFFKSPNLYLCVSRVFNGSDYLNEKSSKLCTTFTCCSSGFQKIAMIV